jgi:hypothetical protein
MTYQATWNNRERTAGGVSISLRLVDDAQTNPYPTKRLRLDFDGLQLSDLTTDFLAGIASKEAAKAIQKEIIEKANKRLDNIVSNRWEADVASALTAMETAIRNRLLAQNLDNTSLQNLILSEWAAYGVSGQLNNPIVRTDILKPTVNSVTDEIVVGN